MPGGYAGDAVASTSRTISSDFALFKSACPLQKFAQPHSHLEWSYYQAGPPDDKQPVVLLHGTSSTAAAFFYQVQALGEKGYRVVSSQYPAYDTPESWCKGFDLFLDALRCRNAHIFGAGLGGFLAQHYAVRYPNRVRSLVLCNAFASADAFAARLGAWGCVIPLMPSAMLRQAMQDAFPQGGFMELSAKQAIDWVALQMNDLSGEDLASRLSLNTSRSYVGTVRLDPSQVTILESSGETMVPEELRRQLTAMYSGARVAQLKSTGDFPYLSRPDEVTLFIEVHLRSLGAFPEGKGPAFSGAEERQASQDAQLLDDWSSRAHAPEPYYAVAEEPVPPRRPVWRNPFEDDLYDPMI
eukprot:TRINITY_DN72606_c0_g1_i1.p1 TRINITY_DN72606_c0_g1~~TRINITY_DN72606_c0_g1_i1.p1  ORF type:complete len:355 (+),score=57.79 TRINITY_DN72606_c0_g1_i1:75-1139(+)